MRANQHRDFSLDVFDSCSCAAVEPSQLTDQANTLTVRQLRFVAAINHLKKRVLGAEHIAGNAQTRAFFDALHAWGEQHGGLRTTYRAGLDPIASTGMRRTDRTWQTWFAKPTTTPKISSGNLLDALATTIEPPLLADAQGDAVDFYSGLINGGLFRALASPNKRLNALEIQAIVTRYTPRSLLHLTFDLLDVCSNQPTGIGPREWKLIRRIVATRSIDVLHERRVAKFSAGETAGTRHLSPTIANLNNSGENWADRAIEEQRTLAQLTRPTSWGSIARNILGQPRRRLAPGIAAPFFLILAEVASPGFPEIESDAQIWSLELYIAVVAEALLDVLDSETRSVNEEISRKQNPLPDTLALPAILKLFFSRDVALKSGTNSATIGEVDGLTEIANIFSGASIVINEPARESLFRCVNLWHAYFRELCINPMDVVKGIANKALS